MQGAPPLASPGLNPRGTGSTCQAGTRRGGVPSESPTRRKTDRTAFLLAVPAAKERGDRGRWNYPSLTRRRRLRWSSPPGQGEQAPRGFSSPPPPADTTVAGSVSVAGGLMQGCRGRSPRRNKLLVSPFPAGEGGRGDRGQKQNERQGRQATNRARPPLSFPPRQGQPAPPGAEGAPPPSPP